MACTKDEQARRPFLSAFFLSLLLTSQADLKVSPGASPALRRASSHATCADYSCPDGYSLQPAPEMLQCYDPQQCGDIDKLTCCLSKSEEQSYQQGVVQSTLVSSSTAASTTAATTEAITESTPATTEAATTVATTASATPTSSPLTTAPSTSAAPSLGPVPNITAISTKLVSSVQQGETTLPVASQSGFSVGHQVAIAPGTAHEEVHEIAAFGSMILKSPLSYAHEAGVEIQNRYLLAHGPPPVGGVNHANNFNHWVTDTFGTAQHPKVGTIAGVAAGGVGVAGAIAAAAVAASRHPQGAGGANPIAQLKQKFEQHLHQGANQGFMPKVNKALAAATGVKLPTAAPVAANLPATTLSADIPQGATTIEVASIVGMAVGDTIKIGDQWNLIKGFPGLAATPARRLQGGSAIELDHPMFTAVPAGTGVRVVHQPANAVPVGAPTAAPAPVTIATSVTPVIQMKVTEAPVATATAAPSHKTVRIIFFVLLGGVGILTICCCVCVIAALISKARKQDYYGVDEEQDEEEEEDE